METGLQGRKALICASSRGLGFACAQALALEGCAIVINGRDEASLACAARQIAQITGVRPLQVVADIATEEGREKLAEPLASADILVTNNGGPPPGDMADWDNARWHAALEANMLSAVSLIQDVVPGMRTRKFGRIVNITSAMVKTPRLAMGLSTAARAGLTAFSKALSAEVIRDNVTINNLLPERIETDRLRYMTDKLAKHKGISLAQAREEMLRPIPAGRFGRPEELAAACIFLCSQQAGYITGQNLQLDGGAYSGLI
jgi:3-oxoacyl-[acyl-carrier protein] reductase|tara:strand:+ start:2870 stop:3649 length:780 start_codon:yes stop_codon:yes gene_type:complete